MFCYLSRSPRAALALNRKKNKNILHNRPTVIGGWAWLGRWSEQRDLTRFLFSQKTGIYWNDHTYFPAKCRNLGGEGDFSGMTHIFLTKNAAQFFIVMNGAIYLLERPHVFFPQIWRNFFSRQNDIYWNDNVTWWTVFWNSSTHFADKKCRNLRGGDILWGAHTYLITHLQ